MSDPNIFVNHNVASNLKKNFMKQNGKNFKYNNYIYTNLSQPIGKKYSNKTPKIGQYGIGNKQQLSSFQPQSQQQPQQQQQHQKETLIATNKSRLLYDLNDDSAIGMSEKQPLIDNEMGSFVNYDDYHSNHTGIGKFKPIDSYDPILQTEDFASRYFDSGHGKMPNNNNNNNNNKSLKYNMMDHQKKKTLEKKKRTTNLQTMMHIFKANIGTGILALPNAFKNAGLYLGLIVLPILCIFCTHCMHILVRANNIISRRMGTGPLEYQDVAANAIAIGPKCLRRFSSLTAILINIFLLVTQFGFCCVYSLFVAENLGKFMGELTTYQYPATTYLLFLLPLFILLSFVKSLRHLSLASSMANLLQTFGLMIVLYYLVKDIKKVPDSVEDIGSFKNFPLFLGTAIYAFEGIGLVLPLQKEMQKPESLRGYVGVLNVSMILVAAINIAIGFFGYRRFGIDVKGSITLNLPAEPLYQSCNIIFATAIFLSYAIQYYVPFTIIWPWFKQVLHLRDGNRNTNIIEYLLRASLVIFTLALAAAIPKLDLFISLVGALSSSAIALIFPPLIDICALWEEEKGFWNWTWIFFKDFTIFLLGVAGLTTGTYASIENIIQNMD